MRLEPGQELGRYRLGEVLGRGGVGTVVAAVHTTLHTEHALKVLRVDDPEGRRRLLAEGRTQARLSHVNVVPVRDALQLEDGRPVLVFERVRGPTLATLLRHASLDTDEALRLWRGVVAGVAHAHAHGVVHRDLTPSNVLLDTAVDPACPRVTDFGIARCLAVEGATAPGQVLGTPGYLAPEQLLDAASAGPAADVFSLGVLGAELLTGRVPHGELRGAAWLAAVEAADGGAPGDIPEPWTGVIARCLRARPQDRFADAGALLQALSPEEHRPPPARAPSAGTPVRPPGISFVGVGLVGLALGVLGVWLLPDPAPAPEGSAPAADLERKAWTRAADHPDEALALLRAAASLRGTPLPDSLVLDLVDRGAAVHVLPLGDSVPAVDVRDGVLAGITTGGDLTLWDAASGETLASFATGVYQARRVQLFPGGEGVLLDFHRGMGRSRTEALAWSREGRAVVHAPGALTWTLADDRVVAEVDGAVVAWDLQGRERWRHPSEQPWGSLTWTDDVVLFSRYEDALAVGLADGEIRSLPDFDGVPMALAPGGASALVRDPGSTRWVTDAGERLGQGPVVSSGNVAWSDGGDALALWAQGADAVTLWRREGAVSLAGHERQGARGRFLPEGQVVTSSWDGQVRLWGERGQPLYALERHGGLVTGLAVDGDVIATSSLDRTVRLWARPDRLLGALRTRQLPGGRPARNLIGGVGGVIVAGTMDGARVTRWEPVTGEVLSLETGERVVEVGIGEGTVAAVQWDGVLRIDRGGRPVAVQAAERPVRLAVSPDGTHVAVVSRSRLQVWTAEGALAFSGPLEGYQVAATFSDDGEHLFVGHGLTGEVDVWRVEAGTAVATLAPDLDEARGVARLAATPDGVVAGFYGGGAQAWSLDGRSRWAADTSDDVVLVRTVDDRVLIGVRDGHVALRDARTGRVRGEVTLEEMPTAALLGPQGVLLGDVRGRLVTWRPGTSPRVRHAHRGPVAHLFREGEAAWSVGVDGLARAWDEAALSGPMGDLRETGALTNLRVCRHTGEIVPVVPYPPAGSVWAPAEGCGSGR